MARPINERFGDQPELLQALMEYMNTSLRVAMPGIIQSFDAEKQTVTVQPTIRERVRDADLNMRWVDFPLLLDVPIVLPRAGGFVVTMPIQQGDECLVVFGDMCIDAWWESGGVQNQIEKRRHDLSDAFAIMGTWSQPRVIQNYSTDSLQIRTESGNGMIELRNDLVAPNTYKSTINLNADYIKKNGSDL